MKTNNLKIDYFGQISITSTFKKVILNTNGLKSKWTEYKGRSWTNHPRVWWRLKLQ